MAMNLNGYIVPDDYVAFFHRMDIAAVSPKELEAWLKSDDPDKTLRINSQGGSMFAGVEMYTLVKEHGGVDVLIASVAGSAASLPAIAGRTVKISPAGMMMIHNVAMSAAGDHNEMEKAKMTLIECNAAICQAYRFKTGLEESVLLEMMNRETWLRADKAKSLGFVDEIAFDKGKAVFNARAMLAVNINNNMRRNIKNGLDGNA